MSETDKPGSTGQTDERRSAERVFARRMKRERTRLDLRQEDLAARLALRDVDLHPSAIAKIEREPDPAKGIEPRMIRLNEAVAIADTLGLTVDRMLSDDDLTEPREVVEQLRADLYRAIQSQMHARNASAAADDAVDRLHQLIEVAEQQATYTYQEANPPAQPSPPPRSKQTLT